MRCNQNFQQIWEFRKRDDVIDSSSDDSKSSSGGKPVLKKNELISNLMLPKNDASSDTPGYLEPGKAVHFNSGKASNKGIGLTRKCSGINHNKKMGSMKGANNKKRNCSTLLPLSLGDLKIFAESILQDLKVERENMFSQMQEDLRKLVNVKSVKRSTKKGRCMLKNGQAVHLNSAESGVKAQNCHDVPLGRSTISNRMTDSIDCYKILQWRVNDEQAIQTIRSNGNDKGETLRLSVKQSMFSSNHYDKIVSSDLVLLYVQSEPKLEQQSTQSSFVGPLHQWLDNTFNMPSQIVLENSAGDNNILGMRLNGEPVRFSGNSQSLCENFAANNFHSHLTYKTNGELAGYETEDHKNGNF